MFINFTVLLVVLGMGYWWGMVQGLFSSFLNFICITVAGCIAFAFWEPFSSLLMEHQPIFAWGVGLLAPFALSFAILRVAMDTFVPGNIRYHTLLNPIGGALIGIISGILISGILIIGVSFLTVPSLAGYEAYAIDDTGKPFKNERLWIPVDTITGNYFSSLSGNAFSPGDESLDNLIPDLARHAALFHLRVDKNSTNVASKSAFRVDMSPIKLSLKSIKGLDYDISSKLYDTSHVDKNYELMIISTEWDQHYTAADSDSRIRLSPNQIRLLCKNDDNQPEELMPIAWATEDKQSDKLKITHNQQASLQIAFNDNQYDIKWLYLIPHKFKPTHLLCRNNRISLTEAQFNENGNAVATILGGASQVALRDDSPILGKFADVVYHSMLPTAISRSYATGVDFQDGKLSKGNSTIRQGDRFVTGGTRVDSIYHPDHQYCIRIRFTTDNLYQLFARHKSSPKRKRPIKLFDERQVRHNCIGYALVTKNNHQIVNIRRDSINTGENLPIDDLNIKDELYLYFVAPKASGSMWLKIGENAQLLRFNHANPGESGPVDFKRIGIVKAESKATLSNRLPTESNILKGVYQGSADAYGIANISLDLKSDKLKRNQENAKGPKIWTEPSMKVVQVKLKGLQAFAFLGNGLLTGKLKGSIILEDNNGNAFKPIGSVAINPQVAKLNVRSKPEYKVYDLFISDLGDIDEVTILFSLPNDRTPAKLIYRESGKPDVEYPF